ncbi:MAG: hypothetical protein HY340_02250 [Candidatus Kerfeldbacteria bacterium]|nr:hypothetical protein [Candidatus Kerfeldbacteria bacterium]
MKFTLKLPPDQNAPVVLNRAGYATFRDPNTGQTSYVKRLGDYFYPRFHLYVQSANTAQAICSLHLDMKQPSYTGSRAHSGEYDGEQVVNEIKRILGVAAQFSAPAPV